MDKLVKHRRLYQAIAVLAVIGFAVAGYSTYLHFSKTPSTICNLSANFNCDTVNKGIYSEVFGIPISLLGMVGYAWMFLLAQETLKDRRRPLRLLFAATIAFSAGFQWHLAWISSQLLNTWCIVCIGSYIVTFLILALFSLAEL